MTTIQVRCSYREPQVTHIVAMLPPEQRAERCPGCGSMYGTRRVAYIYIGFGPEPPSGVFRLAVMGQAHAGLAVPVHVDCAGVTDPVKPVKEEDGGGDDTSGSVGD